MHGALASGLWARMNCKNRQSPLLLALLQCSCVTEWLYYYKAHQFARACSANAHSAPFTSECTCNADTLHANQQSLKMSRGGALGPLQSSKYAIVEATSRRQGACQHAAGGVHTSLGVR